MYYKCQGPVRPHYMSASSPYSPNTWEILSHASSVLAFMTSSIMSTESDLSPPTSSMPNKLSSVTQAVPKSRWHPLIEYLRIWRASIRRGLSLLWCFVSVSALDENTHSEGTEEAWIGR